MRNQADLLAEFPESIHDNDCWALELNNAVYGSSQTTRKNYQLQQRWLLNDQAYSESRLEKSLCQHRSGLGRILPEIHETDG